VPVLSKTISLSDLLTCQKLCLAGHSWTRRTVISIWLFQGYRPVLFTNCNTQQSIINCGIQKFSILSDFTRVLTEWHTDQWIWMETFKVDRMIYKVHCDKQIHLNRQTDIMNEWMSEWMNEWMNHLYLIMVVPLFVQLLSMRVTSIIIIYISFTIYSKKYPENLF